MVAAVFAFIPGCLDMVYSIEINGEEPALEQGEEFTLLINAETVSGLALRDIPDRNLIEFDLDQAIIDPKPDSEVDTYPPVWYWSRTQLEVDIEIPIVVRSDAQPGTYLYYVEVFDEDSRDADSVIEEFEITVIES